MSNEKNIARLAGALYLIVVLTGLFSLLYVPSRINVSGDPHATIDNMIAQGLLFRAGMAAFLIEQVAFVLLPLVLYRLLGHVDRSAAVAMVALSLVSVPIALVGLTHRVDAWDVVSGMVAPPIESGPLHSQVMSALHSYGSGLLVATLFWGLWLLPFGYLVIRSGFLPKVLGLLLILGGLGYVVQVFWSILMPDTKFPQAALLPAAVGEIGICLWLLIVGVRGGRPKSA